MTDHTERRGHTTLAAALAGSRYAGLAAEPDDDEPQPERPTPQEAAEFNRQRALRCIDLWTPPVFRGARAEHPDVTAWARAYIADRSRPRWLLLLGSVGTGKTHQAYGALRLIAESGRPPIAWRAVGASDLYGQLRGRSGDEQQQTLDRYAALDVLILDDLGVTKDTPFTEETIYRLVNRRYETNLPLIITTNMRASDIKDAVGDRTASRLAQMCTQVDLGRGDRRRAR